MTDTPYTLTAETTCDDAVNAMLATLIEFPFTAEQINAAFARVGYVRAAQAVPEARWCKHCGETTVAGLCRGKKGAPEDERAERLALADRDWIGPEGQRMSAAVYEEWAPEAPDRAALYRRAGAKT